jgi:hypothetical protein
MSLSTYLIPVQNVPQTFDIALGGVNYTLTCRWNNALEGGWVLDIGDPTTGNTLAANIPLIAGADCLSGLEYLGIEGMLVVQTNGDPYAVPTLANLGVDSNLYFLTSVPSGN